MNRRYSRDVKSHKLKVLDALWLMYQTGHEGLLYGNALRGEVCLSWVLKTFIRRSSYVLKFFAASSKQNLASVQAGHFLFFLSFFSPETSCVSFF